MKAREKCKFLIPMEFEEANPFADVFTMEEFIEAVEGGEILGYDGIGYLAKADDVGKSGNLKLQLTAMWIGSKNNLKNLLTFAGTIDNCSLS